MLRVFVVLKSALGIVLLAMTIVFSEPPSEAAKPSVQEGVRLAKAGDYEAALSIFEKVSKDDPTFVRALGEIEKIHYRRRDWNRFFAYAFYYQERFVGRPGMREGEFSAPTLALEVLALVRHCYKQKAIEKLTTAYRLASTMGVGSTPELALARSYLELAKILPKTMDPVTDTRHLPRGAFQKTLLWNLDRKSAIDRIDHPRVLRIEVKNRCES